jgi:TetR/AcrR family transcriptional repressor of nem operon
MRYDHEHKQQTRARVLDVAARAIRAEGPERVGVAGIMAQAGLTHGGFYAHFPSKDDLVAEAIVQMFRDAAVKFESTVSGKPAAAALGEYIDFYLSARHRDARDTGCPLAALTTDLPRLSAKARGRFGRGVAWLTQAIAERLEAMGRPDPGALAASALAEMVGALTLARSVADEAQSDAILEATRTALRRKLELPDESR